MKTYYTLLTLLIILLAPACLQAQQQSCKDYACVITRAKNALAAKNYRLAFEQLESAEGYPDKKVGEIAGLRERLFDKVNNERKEAQQQKLRAEGEAENAKIQKKIADSTAATNLRQAEELSLAKKKVDSTLQVITQKQKINSQIIEGMNFYFGKFALSFKNGRYGFMDTLGKLTVPYSYKEATPFDRYTHVALVKKSNIMFVLDTNLTEDQIYDTLKSNEIKAIRWNNHKDNPLPASIFDAKALKYVWINSNEIPSIDARINQLSNLHILDLSNNGLRYVQLSDTFKELLLLNLSENLLYELPDQFKAEKLKKLDLSKNYLINIPRCIYFLNNLEYLDLSVNVLKKVRKEIGQLPELTFLDLSGNSFFEFPVELTNLPKLKSLQISNNRISLITDEINNLSNLEELNLRSNALSTLPDNLSGLKRLRFLDLSNNLFEEIPLSLQTLPSLEELDFTGNNKLKAIPEWLAESQDDIIVYVDESLAQSKLMTKLFTKYPRFRSKIRTRSSDRK